MKFAALSAMLLTCSTASAVCPLDLQSAFGGKTFVGQQTISGPGGNLVGESIFSVRFAADGLTAVSTAVDYYPNVAGENPGTFYMSVSDFVRKTCSAKFEGRLGDANGPVAGTGTFVISPGLIFFAARSPPYGTVIRGEMRPR